MIMKVYYIIELFIDGFILSAIKKEKGHRKGLGIWQWILSLSIHSDKLQTEGLLPNSNLWSTQKWTQSCTQKWEWWSKDYSGNVSIQVHVHYKCISYSV